MALDRGVRRKKLTLAQRDQPSNPPLKSIREEAMSNDRRAQRKAKQRQDRLRQERHQRQFGSDRGGGMWPDGGLVRPDRRQSFAESLLVRGSHGVLPDGRATSGPTMAISIHHVPGGMVYDNERTNRAMNFLIKKHQPASQEAMMALVNQHIQGHGWKETHAQMLLVSPLEHAQETAFQALEAWDRGDAPTARRLAEAALAEDPRCCDARTALARMTSDWAQAVELLLTALTDEHERLGGDAFRREKLGHYWSINATRPYMRAMLFRLIAHRNRADAAAVLTDARTMLDLDEQDRLGIRYHHLAATLAMGDPAQMTAALAGRHVPNDAEWLWARVLERFLVGGAPAADAVLDTAMKANDLVRIALHARDEERCPPIYQPGDYTEAQAIAEIFGWAWDIHRPALAWLDATLGD